MSCYFPLHAFKAKSKDASKTVITFRRSESWRGQKLDLPCGQCVGCRLERSRQWAIRCMHEASLYDRNCFLTLTYDQKHLPSDGSLHLEHFQLFMKRLRKKYGSSKENPIRFYHCGEYGEQFARPHYHALLFNHDFEDKRYFSERNGNRVYTSDSLSDLWKEGFSVIGDVTFESAAYVARYVMKKVTGEKAEEHYGSRRPEYTTMSRRPGIGKLWFDKFRSDVYPRDGVIVRGRLTRPPRYYDRQLELVDPSTMALLKIKRESNEHFVEDVYNGKVLIESDSSMRRLAVKNEVKLAQISSLRRHKDGV